MPITTPINCFGAYEISSFGRLKRAGRIAKTYGHWIPERIIKCWPNDKGYVKAKLGVIGKRKQYSLHRLVALHFIPNPDNLPEVNHKDFNKLNNHKDNLEWTTGKGNMDHYYNSGLVVRGARDYKLSVNDVIYIRQNLWNEGIIRLAKRFNTRKEYIYAVGTGRKRTDVDYPVLCKIMGPSKIILDINTGIFYESPKELADLLGIKSKYLCRTICEERRPNKTPYRYV